VPEGVEYIRKQGRECNIYQSQSQIPLATSKLHYGYYFMRLYKTFFFKKSLRITLTAYRLRIGIEHGGDWIVMPLKNARKSECQFVHLFF